MQLDGIDAFKRNNRIVGYIGAGRFEGIINRRAAKIIKRNTAAMRDLLIEHTIHIALADLNGSRQKETQRGWQHGTIRTTHRGTKHDELRHIAVLHQGRIVASGTASELKKLVPGGLIELTFHDEETRDAAAKVLGKSYAHAEGEGATLTITTDGTVAQVAGIFAGLENARIDPTEFSQKVATLDDVFLKITDTGRGDE